MRRNDRFTMARLGGRDGASGWAAGGFGMGVGGGGMGAMDGDFSR